AALGAAVACPAIPVRRAVAVQRAVAVRERGAPLRGAGIVASDELDKVDRTEVTCLVWIKRLLSAIMNHKAVRDKRVSLWLSEIVDVFFSIGRERQEARGERLAVWPAAVGRQAVDQRRLLRRAQEADLGREA